MNLTDRDRETLKAFADNDMSLSRTGDSMYFCARTIIWRLNKIKAKTGLDPRKFWDLVKLLGVRDGQNHD